MGDSERDAAAAFLTHLVEAALLGDGEGAQAAIRAAETARAELGGSWNALHLDGLWAKAVLAAEAALRRERLAVSMTLPATCPLTADDLVDPAADPRALAERIRLSASTG